jgi:hypothetical protein
VSGRKISFNKTNIYFYAFPNLLILKQCACDNLKSEKGEGIGDTKNQGGEER